MAVLAFAIHCKATNAIALNCQFEMVRPSYDGIYTNELYTCTATLLIGTRSNDGVTAIFGLHQTGKDNDDVLGLRINSQNMEFFPTNIEEFFPNIEAIDFYDNAITSISNRHLNPFPNLSFLSLPYNRIASLDSNLFVGLNALQYIFLSNNVVTSIQSNVFVGLNSGSLFDLSNNRIRHIGHDLILPTFANIWLYNNTCVNTTFDTESDVDVEEFKFNLLLNCPPTIGLIESNLESRPNFIADLIDRVRRLEAAIESKYEIKIDENVNVKRSEGNVKLK